MDGTLPLHQLLSGVVVLAGHAIGTSIGVFDDVAVVVDFAQELADRVVVALLGRANEVIVRDIEDLPGLGESSRGSVGPLPGSHLVLLRRFRHLLAMLVGTSQEKDVLPEQSVPASNGISIDGAVGVAEVRYVVDVVDRRGDVEAVHCPSVPVRHSRQ